MLVKSTKENLPICHINDCKDRSDHEWPMKVGKMANNHALKWFSDSQVFMTYRLFLECSPKITFADPDLH